MSLLCCEWGSETLDGACGPKKINLLNNDAQGGTLIDTLRGKGLRIQMQYT